MKYSTLSLDFENKVVIDKTKWKEIWDDCMEPDSFAEYVYIGVPPHRHQANILKYPQNDENIPFL